MALPGGAADKQGNYYELLWTVQQCLYMIRGDFDAIHIEDPAYEKSEFTLKKNNTTRLYTKKIRADTFS